MRAKRSEGFHSPNSLLLGVLNSFLRCVRLAAGQHKADTVTNKKGDKTGDKGRQQARKADTMTNKERNKKGDKGKQQGHKADTVTREKETEGRRGGRSDQQEGRQDRRQEGRQRETKRETRRTQ